MTAVGPVADTLGEPAERISVRWVLAFSLATAGTFAGWYGPLQILLAKQADLFAPGGKEGVLALAAGLGALFSPLANPVWGALSDRTVSRYGRRIPWIAAGAVGGAGGLVLMAVAQHMAVVIVGWCLVQTALNAPFAALSAAIPDQVPVRQRGTAGGYFGVAQTVGIMAGTGLAVAGGGIVGGYLACAAFVLLAPLPYLLLRRDQVLPAALRPAWSWRGFWLSPARHPGLGWAWRLADAIRSWDDQMVDAILAETGRRDQDPTETGETRSEQGHRYAASFPEGYKEDFPAAEALADLRRLESLTGGNELATSLYRAEDGGDRYWGFNLSGNGVRLSAMLPLLQSMGVEVVDERPYEIRHFGVERSWIYDFGIIPERDFAGAFDELRPRFEEAFAAAWRCARTTTWSTRRAGRGRAWR